MVKIFPNLFVFYAVVNEKRKFLIPFFFIQTVKVFLYVGFYTFWGAYMAFHGNLGHFIEVTASILVKVTN